MTPEEFCTLVNGKPWVNRAEGPDAYDCFGVVLDSFRKVDGVELPQISGYADKNCPTEEAAKEAQESGLFPECRPKNGAIVAIYDKRGNINHVGRVMCGKILHATSALGVRHDKIKTFLRQYPTARFHEYNAANHS